MKKHCLLVLSTCLIAAGCHRGEPGQMGASAEKTQSLTGDGASADVAVATATTNQETSSTAPDNTAKNSRDRAKGALTPMDQGESQADLTITRRIRHALVSDHQLSSEAKNVKIITVNGRVTLRGPVKSQQEKQTINDITKLVGAAGVDDQLEVTGTKQ